MTATPTTIMPKGNKPSAAPLLSQYDAALAEQRGHYEELRRAALTLLYLKAKLRAEQSDQLSRVRWHLATVQEQMLRCQQQLQHLRRGRLDALVMHTCRRTGHIEPDQPATSAWQEATLLAEAHAEIDQHLGEA